jgi:hypothetical protein
MGPSQRRSKGSLETVRFLAAFLTFPGYPRLDVASPQSLATLPCVVGLVSVQLYRTLVRAAPTRSRDRLDGVHKLFEDCAVVGVGGGEDYRERDAVSVRHKVALGARLSAVRRILAGLLAPLLAGTFVESNDARSQSILSVCAVRWFPIARRLLTVSP